MLDTNDASKITICVLWLVQIAGRLLLLSYVLSFLFAFVMCSPWHCPGHSDMAYLLPFMATFTIFPVGLILFFVTRKVKGEKSYGRKSVQKFSASLYLTGLLFILWFLWRVGRVLLNCFEWKCFLIVLQSMPLPFVPFYALLPLGIVFIAFGSLVTPSANSNEKTGGCNGRAD